MTIARAGCSSSSRGIRFAAATLACAAFGTATLGWSGAAHAEPIRILIAAGHKEGLAAEHPLKYADTDASRVRDVMIAYGGVKPEHTIVLAEPSRAELLAAIDRSRDDARTHKPEEVTLVFYFSGHGDRDAIHLGGERVLLTEIAAKLEQVPAALRIAITDACRTTRDKGFVADEPFTISATTNTQASGQVWLHASSDGEAAQESDELHGALFTHAWLNGLRGAADANGDARVTLDESFAFAYSQTLIRSANSSGVMQKPEAVVNLHELAPVVLTQTAARMSTVSLPIAKDAHFLVYAGVARSVISELWGSPDRRIALAVPPGRYVVQRRVGSLGGAAQIALVAGEERKLEDRDFTASTLDAVAAKGDDANPVDPDVAAAPPPALSPHEVEAGYEAGADTRTGLMQGPRAGYAYAFGRFAFSLGGGADFSGRTLPDTTEHLASAFGRAGIEVRVPWDTSMLRFGAGARAGWLWQTLDPTAASAATTHDGAFVAGPEVLAAYRMNVGTRLFAELDARGSLLFLREASHVRGVTGVTGGLMLGARF